ncbi:MAG: pseudoazurin [Pseudomonadota bacterium]
MKLFGNEMKTAFAATGLAIFLSACGGSDPATPTADEPTTTDVETVAEVVEEAVVEPAAEEAEALVEAATEEVEDIVEDVSEDVADVVEEATDVVEETTDVVEDETADVASTGRVVEVGMFTVNPDNRRETMVFTPNLLQLNVGDTVKWVATEPSHQSASIPGMIPEGVEAWYSQINADVEYTFTKPGIYGYQCVPHYAGGMVGLIVVEGEGKLDNLDAAKAVRHPGLAGRRFEDIWAAAEEAGYLSE